MSVAGRPVADVSLASSGLSILIGKGTAIHTRSPHDEEYTFWLSDFETWGSGGDWSIVQDFGDTYVRTPPKKVGAEDSDD